MAATPVIPKHHPIHKIHRIAFSHDKSFISVAHAKGFVIFRTNPIEKLYELDCGGLRFAQQLFSTAAVFTVGSGDTSTLSPRNLNILVTTYGKPIKNYMFETTICGLQVNNKRMAVILEREIHIFSVSDQSQRLRTLQTASNPYGIATMSISDRSFLAYPAPDPGYVCIYDANLCEPLCAPFQAHNGAIEALAFNSEGSYLATASSKGTIVRVFSIAPGSPPILVFEFRRGTTPTTIHHLEFSATSTLLACISRHGTVHIFKLTDDVKVQPPSGLWWYVPTKIATAFDYRSTLSWSLPNPEVLSVCGFLSDSTLLVATYDGKCYTLSLDDTACNQRDEHILIPAIHEEPRPFEDIRIPSSPHPSISQPPPNPNPNPNLYPSPSPSVSPSVHPSTGMGIGGGSLHPQMTSTHPALSSPSPQIGGASTIGAPPSLTAGPSLHPGISPGVSMAQHPLSGGIGGGASIAQPPLSGGIGGGASIAQPISQPPLSGGIGGGASIAQPPPSGGIGGGASLAHPLSGGIGGGASIAQPISPPISGGIGGGASIAQPPPSGGIGGGASLAHPLLSGLGGGGSIAPPVSSGPSVIGGGIGGAPPISN